MSVLVASDLSEHSQDAVRWASAYATEHQTPLHICHIIDTLGEDELWTALFDAPDKLEERILRTAAERVRAFANDSLDGFESPNDRHVLIAVGTPHVEIDKFAREKQAELIVCGTSGHGRLRNMLFGSTAHRLTHATHRPLLFVPECGHLPPAKHVLVAVDFSECSQAALRWAASAASRWGSSVTAVHSLGVSAMAAGYEQPETFAPMVDVLVGQREDALGRQLADHSIVGSVVISRLPPGLAIVETAAEVGADLIVMGTHGRGAVGRLLLGSVALRVLRQTKVPVATIHANTKE